MNQLKTTLVMEVARLRHAGRPVRLLVIAALTSLALGLGHVVVWAVDGGSWGGPVSWRKPIVFGISIAATTAALAWVVAQLPRTRGRFRAALVYVVAIGLEYGLIAMQRWRGVASHFNFATRFDAAIFAAMGALILTASVVIVLWTIAAVRSTTLPPDRKATIVGGMVLLDVGLVLGLALSVLGGLPPGLIPPPWIAALKPSHAIALHGMQALPLVWLWLARREPRVALRALRVTIASVAYGLVAVAVFLHVAGAATVLSLGFGVAAALGFAASLFAPLGAPRRAAVVEVGR
jgi:hypothetical protein